MVVANESDWPCRELLLQQLWWLMHRDSFEQTESTNRELQLCVRDGVVVLVAQLFFLSLCVWFTDNNYIVCCI